VVGFGAVLALPRLASPERATSTAARPAMPDSAGGAGAPAASDAGGTAPSLALLSSGRDYQPGTVRGVAPQVAAQAAPNDRGQQSVPGAKEVAPLAAPTAVPDPLRRLAEPSALAACVSAITREYGGQVTLVDFARFQGSPALVVLLTGAFHTPGRQWVVVVGPRCGQGGAIADEVYNTPVS
jgi:hypothetical protein